MSCYQGFSYIHSLMARKLSISFLLMDPPNCGTVEVFPGVSNIPAMKIDMKPHTISFILLLLHFLFLAA